MKIERPWSLEFSSDIVYYVVEHTFLVAAAWSLLSLKCNFHGPFFCFAPFLKNCLDFFLLSGAKALGVWAIIIFTFESIHCSVAAVLKLLNIVVFLHMNCEGTETL